MSRFSAELVNTMQQTSAEIFAALPYSPPEGSASVTQMAHLATLAANLGAVNIGEIGFNTGHSTSAFLSSDPSVRVTSFDIGTHDYVELAKSRVDTQYPERHTLILGDSRSTVSNYDAEPFDLLFIDGGHDYTTAMADIRNGKTVSREGATVIVDDLVPYRFCGAGPSVAWTKAVLERVIFPSSLHYELPQSNAPTIGKLAIGFLRLKGWGVGLYQ